MHTHQTHNFKNSGNIKRHPEISKDWKITFIKPQILLENNSLKRLGQHNKSSTLEQLPHLFKQG